eukprot:588756-Amphidinium_carterae.1
MMPKCAPLPPISKPPQSKQFKFDQTRTGFSLHLQALKMLLKSGASAPELWLLTSGAVAVAPADFKGHKPSLTSPPVGNHTS